MYNILIKLRILCRRISAIIFCKRAEIELQDHVLSDLARCFLADIRAFFAIETNQEAYKKWLQEHNQTAQNTNKKN